MIRLRGGKAELTTFVGRGDLTIPELVEAYSNYMTQSPSRLVLWDLRGGRLTGDTDDLALWKLAEAAVRLAEGRRTAGRTAIVCSCPEDLCHAGTVRRYFAIARYPVQVKEFVDMKMAMTWLVEEPAP
jgi:hypothetical protein